MLSVDKEELKYSEEIVKTRSGGSSCVQQIGD